MRRGHRAVTFGLATVAVALALGACAAEGSDRGQPPQDTVAPQASTTAEGVHGTPDSSGAGLDWVEDYEAVCVSMVRGVAPAKAVEELTSGRARTFPSRVAAEDWVVASDDDDRYWIAAGQIGDWTFVWEDNGFQGSLDRSAVRLSAGTVFVSAYWNVNAVETFTLARNGHIVRQFDPVLDRNGGTGDALPAEARLDWDEAEVSMLRLQATITDEEPASWSWLDAPGVSFWGSTQ